MKLTLRFRDQATPKLREMKQQVDAIQKRMDGGRVVSSVDEFRREYGSPEKLIEKIDLGWATSRTLYTRQDYIDAAFDASVFVETVDVQTNPLHVGVVRVLIRGLNGFTTDALLGRVYEYLSAWAPLNVQIEVDALELPSEFKARVEEAIQYLWRKDTDRERWTGRSRIEILSGTKMVTQGSGPHSPECHLDEVELMDEETMAAADYDRRAKALSNRIGGPGSPGPTGPRKCLRSNGIGGFGP